jgi:Protein of unknown function (DUF3618)
VSQASTPAHRSTDIARSQRDIQAELEAARVDLAGTIDQLTYRVNPKTIIKRKLDEVKAQFVDEQGKPRPEKIAAVAGAAVGVVAFFVVVRKLVNRD